MAVAAAITIGRSDGGGAERAAVIAALEGEHQALAVPGVADELQRIFHRLRAADVEMHAALEAEFSFGILRDRRGKLDLLAVEILACDLRQPVDLAFQRVVETLVGVAEIDGRVPHLKVEVLLALAVVDERAFATLEDFRYLGIVNRVAERAIFRFEREQFLLVKLGFVLRDEFERAGLIKHVAPVQTRYRPGAPRPNSWKSSLIYTRASRKDAIGRKGIFCSRQNSTSFPLAKTRSDSCAKQKSERPSPIRSRNLPSDAVAHLQKPLSLRQSSLKFENPARHERRPSETSRLQTRGIFTPIRARIGSMKRSNPSETIFVVAPSARASRTKCGKLKSVSTVSSVASISSGEAERSAACRARHSREPMRPATHTASTSRHFGAAKRSSIRSVVSPSVTVPSKSMVISRSMRMFVRAPGC